MFKVVVDVDGRNVGVVGDDRTLRDDAASKGSQFSGSCRGRVFPMDGRYVT